MKFGEILLQEMRQDWKEHYVNYEMLKNSIKKLSKGNNTSSGKSIENETEEATSPKKARSSYDGAKFTDSLRGEIEKVTTFAEIQEQLFKTRLGMLNRHLDHLREWKKSGLPDVDPMIEKLANDFSELGSDIADLLNFVVLNSLGLRKIVKKYERWTGQSSGGGIILDATESGWLNRLSNTRTLSELVSGVQSSLVLTNELRITPSSGFARISSKAGGSDLSISVQDSPNSQDSRSDIQDVYEDTGYSSTSRFGIILVKSDEPIIEARKIYEMFHLAGTFLFSCTWMNMILSLQLPTSSLSFLPLTAGILYKILFLDILKFKVDEIWVLFVAYLSGAVGSILLWARDMSLWDVSILGGNDPESATWWSISLCCALLGIPAAAFTVVNLRSSYGPWMSTWGSIAGTFFGRLAFFQFGIQFFYLVSAILWAIGFFLFFGIILTSSSIRLRGNWQWCENASSSSSSSTNRQVMSNGLNNNRVSHSLSFVRLLLSRLLWTGMIFYFSSKGSPFLLFMVILNIPATLGKFIFLNIPLGEASFLGDFLVCVSFAVFKLR